MDGREADRREREGLVRRVSPIFCFLLRTTFSCSFLASLVLHIMVTFGKAFAPGGAFGPQRLNELDPPLQTENLHGLFAGGLHPAKQAWLGHNVGHWIMQNRAKECNLPTYYRIAPKIPLAASFERTLANGLIFLPTDTIYVLKKLVVLLYIFSA